MIERAALLAAFRSATGHDAEVAAFAPGRVNLIGEHTDYNEGFVLPAAIDRGVAVAARRVPGDTFTLHALDLRARVTFPRGRFQRDDANPWANYFQGVIWALSGRGLEVPACEAAVTGDLPRGAGLSSSAAYEVATALVLRALGNLALSSLDVAKLAREAENGFVGVACGIMDQMASTFGAAGHALLLDCRSLAHQTVEIPKGLAIVVAGTGVHHELASSEYNKRRAECEEGVRILSSLRAGVRSLRDVEPDDVARFFGKLPPVVRKRCRHVVSENARVLETVKALRAGDNATLKTLLVASHFSLRDDYEVSCPELDVLVDLALGHPACHGARLTGAGFGGSTVNLVDAGAVEAFSTVVSDGYQSRLGRAAEIYVFKPSAGAQLL